MPVPGDQANWIWTDVTDALWRRGAGPFIAQNDAGLLPGQKRLLGTEANFGGKIGLGADQAANARTRLSRLIRAVVMAVTTHADVFGCKGSLFQIDRLLQRQIARGGSHEERIFSGQQLPGILVDVEDGEIPRIYLDCNFLTFSAVECDFTPPH